MHRFLPTLLALTILAPAPALADYPTHEPEDYAGLTCEFPFAITWNSDYPTPAPECAMKIVSEMVNVTLECAWSDADHCLALTEHVFEVYVGCLEAAIKAGG